MRLDKAPPRIPQDAAAELLLNTLKENIKAFELEKAHWYYDFPLYREEGELISAKVLLLSPVHGVIMFLPSTITDRGGAIDDEFDRLSSYLEQAQALVFSRLIKSNILRSGGMKLSFNMQSAIYAPHLKDAPSGGPQVVNSPASLREFIKDQYGPELEDNRFSEILAVIDGTRAMVRAKPRKIPVEKKGTKAEVLAKIERQIIIFDEEQKAGAQRPVLGTQRIRGLAGSGKTIILAAKVALTHLREREATIAFTFYTKSLYQYIRRLVTRFYRQYDDRDPDWEKVLIMHGWGGHTLPGVYSQACMAHGIQPSTYSDVKFASDPFGEVCQKLLESAEISPIYDYLFVDEGQDFPNSFIKLGHKLARDGRLVFASDDLQSIFRPSPTSLSELFGTTQSGEPCVSLDEDVVLEKCYRNPLEILVVAHAIGFGIYSPPPVQMLENDSHWKDLGYIVKSGELSQGSEVNILRPKHNSPSIVSDHYNRKQIVQAKAFDEWQKEVEWAAERIAQDINEQGLNPEDILVIIADDRNAKLYARYIDERLAQMEITTNNLALDKFGIQEFTRADAITITSIHKAKGNEAYAVYVLGLDALFERPTVRTRNMVFAAMTRAKAWVTVTACGAASNALVEEVETALKNIPYLKFQYPDPSTLRVMKRDLEEGPAEKFKQLLSELQAEMSIQELDELVNKEWKALKQSARKRPSKSKGK